MRDRRATGVDFSRSAFSIVWRPIGPANELNEKKGRQELLLCVWSYGDADQEGNARYICSMWQISPRSMFERIRAGVGVLPWRRPASDLTCGAHRPAPLSLEASQAVLDSHDAEARCETIEDRLEKQMIRVGIIPDARWRKFTSR